MKRSWQNLRLLLAVVLGGTACAPALVWEAKSPCQQQQIRVEEDHARQRVLVGNRAGVWYDGIGVDEISSDGTHWAYPARVGNQWTVVLDGREIGRWDGVGELRFASHGRLAFSAERDGRWYVVSDGTPGPSFDAILAGALRWSADGRVLVYAGRRGGFASVVWNGIVGPAFDGIARLHIDRHGGRMAYLGRRSDGWHWVDGTSVGPAHDAIVDLAMSSDGKHVAHVWRDGAEEGLVVDGVVLPSFRDSRLSQLSIDDAGRLTFVASRSGRSCVVHFGQTESCFTHIANLVNTQADHYAYLGDDGHRVHILIDGEERGVADAVEDIRPSPDGNRFLRVLRRSQQWIVADDDREVAFDQVVAGSAAWSRDSRHWGIIAGDAGSRRIFISIDGRDQRPLDMRNVVLLAEKRPHADAADAEANLRAMIAAEVDSATHVPNLCAREP